MKRLLPLLFALVLCAVEVDTLDVQPFTGLKLEVSCDATVTFGEETSVIVWAKDGYLNDLRVKVSPDGVLAFSTDASNLKNPEFRAAISTPFLERIKITGSGDITSIGTNIVDTLAISIEGSGDITMNSKTDHMMAEILGSGDMQLTGTTELASMRVAGSGDISANSLEASTVEVDLSGSGDVEVSPKDLLRVKIMGSGDVTYSGNPKVQKVIIGSGDLNHR